MKFIVCMMPLLLLSGCACPIKTIKQAFNKDPRVAFRSSYAEATKDMKN